MCKKLGYLSVILLGVGIDQVSKYYAVQSLIFGQPKAIVQYFNWSLNYNKGVAFGLFNQYEAAVQMGLILMVLSMIIGLFIWLGKIYKADSWQAISLSLILGGAIGNLIDRIILGHVVDFIDFYIGNWHWPTFNIADSLICIGAAMLALGIFKQESAQSTSPL